MVVHHCAVHKPRGSSRVSDLKNDSYEVDPAHTPEVGEKGFSSVDTDCQIECKEEWQWEVYEVGHCSDDVKERVSQTGEDAVGVAKEQGLLHTSEGHEVRLGEGVQVSHMPDVLIK